MEQVVSFLFKYRLAVFAKSQFGFAARPSTILLVAIGVAVLLLGVYLYSRKSQRVTDGWRVTLIAIRCALIVAMALCLMRPVIVVPAVIPQSSFAAVLMDDSASMLIADEKDQPRIETARQLMTTGSAFHTALTEKFKVRGFRFAGGADPLQDPSELTGSGQHTNLVNSIDQALRDLSGLPIAGVIVISDGAQTTESDIGGLITNLRGRGAPVFAVGVGRTTLEGDLELVRATAPRRLLPGSPATAELLIRASGIPEQSVKIELIEDNHHLRTQVVPLQGKEVTEVVRISFTPSSPGLHSYTVIAQPLEGEPVKENNTQRFVLEVEDSHPRVLYLEGEPRWEFGKLRGAMGDEKNVTLVSLLRSADGKFYRQGVESGEELTSGFPKAEEDIFKYQALIIGSIEATFFTFDQLRAIEQFVARRGGSLLALAGSKAFNAGGYANTPLADLLPVYLRGEPAAPAGSQTFKVALAERGRDHRVARLAEQQDQNVKSWEQMPAITLPEVLSETKPGATVILEARSADGAGQSAPLLVEERYGRGRTLAMMASDTWRWRMMLDSKNKVFETFWRNLMRYMVESVRRQVEADLERTAYVTGEPVRIRVEVADKKFTGIADAQVSARVTTPTGQALVLQALRSGEAGFAGYAASLVPDEEGVYRVEVTARKGEETVGETKMTFLAGPPNREAFGAAQNEELLRRLAIETGGAYYNLDQAKNLVEDMTHTETGSSVRATYELWDMPINFLIVVGLAAVEWFIRKRKGLA